MVNRELGIRASVIPDHAHRPHATGGLKFIVFARSRMRVEVLTKYLKMSSTGPRRTPRILAYRGGYLPSERRGVEKACAPERGQRGHTFALELGVDIGALDVAVLNGYPGTVAATRQRLGRAGRRMRPSLGVLVASSSPLDQYIVRHPELFFDASPEHARIAPDQLLILLEHVRCAAFELPFGDKDRFGGEDLQEMLRYLQDQGIVQHQGERRWYWVADSYPANAVRCVRWPRAISSSSISATAAEHPRRGGLHQCTRYHLRGCDLHGPVQPYQVERLDWTGRKAFVRSTKADYYTDAIDYTRLKILDRFEGRGQGQGAVAHGEVHLVRRYSGYKKIRYYTHDNVGYGKIELPDQEMHTTAVWWQCPRGVGRLPAGPPAGHRRIPRGSLCAAPCGGPASMAELRDLGRAVGDGQGTWSPSSASTDGAAARRRRRGRSGLGDRFEPTLFLYDNYPGGVGLAAPLFDGAADLVEQAQRLVTGCDCVGGCPACVGPVLAGDEDHEITPKAAALRVLELLGPARAEGLGPRAEQAWMTSRW